MGLFDEPEFQGGLSGAASGAMMGSAFGPWGTGIGAGVGLIGGLFSGSSQRKQQNNLAEARRKLQEQARIQYQQRMNDLGRAMEYFQPVNKNLQKLYGHDAAPDVPFVPPERAR